MRIGASAVTVVIVTFLTKRGNSRTRAGGQWPWRAVSPLLPSSQVHAVDLNYYNAARQQRRHPELYRYHDRDQYAQRRPDPINSCNTDQ